MVGFSMSTCTFYIRGGTAMALVFPNYNLYHKTHTQMGLVGSNLTAIDITSWGQVSIYINRSLPDPMCGCGAFEPVCHDLISR